MTVAWQQLKIQCEVFTQCSEILHEGYYTFLPQNFGFVRLASHEAALAAITHLQGMQLHGRVSMHTHFV